MSRDSNENVKVKSPGTLASTFEAHIILGVPRSTISRWLKDPKQRLMPAPVDRPKAGPVWRTRDIVLFKRERDGLPKPSKDELAADLESANAAVAAAADD